MEENTNMICARVKQYTSADVSKSERHNERKNNFYSNVNVNLERTFLNVHFKDPGESSYMDVFRSLENEGKISTRGLRQDATLFDELIIDVNTKYFEDNGGYEFARNFYKEAYNYVREKYGEDNIVSAVMHADEINKAITDECDKAVYHYHLHVIAIPTVKKEIKWTKRCKDKELYGTVKEVINQVSHSKKWKSDEPMMDEDGNPVLRINGKPKYRASYSILQDEIFSYMTEHGYSDIVRGEIGSTREHLESLQYQIMKDRERLKAIDNKIEDAQKIYEPMKEDHEKCIDIDELGKKQLLSSKKYTVDKSDLDHLRELAKEGIASRTKINNLERELDYTKGILKEVKEKLHQVEEKCKVFLEALERVPSITYEFLNKAKERIDIINYEREQRQLKQQQSRERERKTERGIQEQQSTFQNSIKKKKKDDYER